MTKYTQDLTVLGFVRDCDPSSRSFTVECRSGDIFRAFVSSETKFRVLENLDGLNNDRVANPDEFNSSAPSPAKQIEKYIAENELVAIQGVYQVNGGNARFDARTVHLLASKKGSYLFEETHWWITQTARLADQWLDSLFGDKRTYDVDDWTALYRTNLNILGLPVDDTVQECAVLSRLIYGLSAAYLIVGDVRYYKAAEAAVRFQREAFRSLSHDGRYCFWAFGRRKGRYGTEMLVPSQSGDDTGSIPLYEQIYALAGLANYYRISLDWEVLEDIRRTVRAFNQFYLDERRQNDAAFAGHDGYFSHIDYSTMRPDQNPNSVNNLKKNWNSVGDHIPSYLVNLLIALDPVPLGGRGDLKALGDDARTLLTRVTKLILDRFPDEDPKVPFVNERFLADWTPDHAYSWQQNRAIVGHNFKIAWNLTRVGNYYQSLLDRAQRNHDPSLTDFFPVDLATRCLAYAEKLAKAMSEVGIDQIRGGCFDAVEREPYAGTLRGEPVMPVEFTWGNTKDFWQQEQAILAYLILYGRTGRGLYLDMARQTEAFWNLFFLDREHRGMYFRVTDSGLPVVQGGYEIRGGHSDASGYHCFELNYLAHIYNRCYVSDVSSTDASFCLYFRPSPSCEMRSLNVLPDFLTPGSVEIEAVVVNGVPREHVEKDFFQIPLDESDLSSEIVVRFKVVKGPPETAESSGKK